MQTDFMTVAIFYWAFIQNFLVGTLVAFFNRARANYLLASIFLLTAGNILAQYFFHYTELKYTLSEIIFLPDILDLVIPSLVYLYLSLLLNARPGRSVLPYFLPAAVASLILVGNVLITPDYGFFDYIKTDLHRGILASIVGWKLFILYRSGLLLRRQKARLLAKGPLRYWWPKIFVLFLVASSVVAANNLAHMAIVAPNYQPSELADFREILQFIFVTFNSIIVLAVFYYLFRHPRVFSGKPLLRPIDLPAQVERNENREKLMRAMEVDRIYLENELNEKMLADRLGIPSYALSRLLNEEIGKSFSVFTNEYRISEAQRVLREDEDKLKTNFAIALESGFRSESVFYVNFKKITGTTPNKYRKLVKAEVEAA